MGKFYGCGIDSVMHSLGCVRVGCACSARGASCPRQRVCVLNENGVMKKMKSHRTLQGGMPWVWAALFCVSAASLPLQGQVTGQWDFLAGNLTATVGVDLAYFDGPGGATQQATQFGTTTTFGISDIEGQAVPVMRVPKNTADMGLLMDLQMSPNGGGGLVNQYSLVMDLFYPAASSGLNRTLLQGFDPFSNLAPATLMVNTANGVGVDGVFQGDLTPDAWHRLVVTVDLAAEPPSMAKYIDGEFVGQQTLSEGVDMRWSLFDSALLFTESQTRAEVTYVSSIQVHNEALSPSYAAALGGPSANKIPVTVTPRALVWRIEPEPGDSLVVPPTVLEIEIREGSIPVPQDQIEWTLNGESVVPVVSRPSSGVLLLRHNPGPLPPVSVNTVSLRFYDPSVEEEVDAGEWSFTMAPYNLPPLDPTLGSMLYLGFDEPDAQHEGAVLDGSPEANHGVLHLAEGTVGHKIPGVVGQALDFQNGPINYVELTKPWSGPPNTLSVWVNLSPEIPAGTRPGSIVGTYPAANNINWEVHTSGRPRVYWNGGNPDWNVTGVVDLRTGEWEHLAFVRDAAADIFKLYVNGREAASRTAVGLDVFPTVPSLVGSDYRDGMGIAFRGALDELVVYDRPLSEVEIWRLYARSLDIPTYQFDTPQVVDTLPKDASTRQSPLPLVEAWIDEFNSATAVDRDTVQMRFNGQAVPVAFRQEGNLLVLSHQIATPVAPETEVTVEIQFETDGVPSEMVTRSWLFQVAPLPVITAEPEDRSVVVGATLSLAVSVEGLAPMTYQWRRDGMELVDATDRVLRLAEVTVADAGLYDVLVRDQVGEVTSRAARVHVVVLPTDPAESLQIGLRGHWPYDGDFSSPVFGYDGLPRNGASISTEARIGTGSVRFHQNEQQWVQVSRQVIDDNSLVYSSAGWFRLTGGTGRRFLWETAPAHWAISTEITAGDTLRVFTRNAELVQRDLDTGIMPEWDQWHHVGVVFDAGAGEATIYFNGEQAANFELVQGVGTAPSTGFHMGTYRGGNDRFFDGYLDDVAVWDRTLTAAEVAWLAQGNGVPEPLPPPLDPIVIVQAPQGGSEWLGSTLFLSVSATGTEPLLYQWKQDGQEVAGATSPRLALSLTEAALGGDYTVVITDAEKSVESAPARVEVRALPDEMEELLLAGLHASWSLDTDFSSSTPGFDGEPMNGTAIVPEARIGSGSALFSQAAGNYVRVGAPVIANSTLTYTVAGWFRSGGGSGRRFLWETSPSHWAISAEISVDGDVRVFTRDANSASVTTGPTSVVPAVGDWHHLAVVYHSMAGEVWVYVDGVRLEQPMLIEPGVGTAPTAAFHLGTFRDGNGRFFEGQLDDIGVWGRMLTEREIEHLAAGNAIPAPPVQDRVWLGVGIGDAGVVLNWSGGQAPYQVEYREQLGSGEWLPLGDPTDETTVVDPDAAETRFYRIVSAGP